MPSQSDFDAGTGSAARAPLPFLSSEPVLYGQQTVVHTPNQGQSPLLAPSRTDVPSTELLHRLFPPGSGDGSSVRRQNAAAGVRLGHYTIEERIGAGGMGAVFRGQDERLQRTVALKILAPSQALDPSSVQRFVNEARAAARLDHENIARVYSIGEDHGLHFIAYEFVAGTNIRELLRTKGRLDPAEAVGYTLQVATALLHTSAAGVVHRDIKPSNLIVTPTGRVKLVDLGLARKPNLDGADELTVAGTTLGTFDYISPEQAKDPRNVDVRSDIYSLGCTLYHMLSGEPPYPEGTVLQKLLDHHGSDPPDPARLNRRVPPELSAIVRRMMASDPRRRYPHPESLIRDLLAVAARLGLRGTSPEGLLWAGSVEPAKFWHRHLGWATTAVALLAIVVLLERFPNLGGTPGPNQETTDARDSATRRTRDASDGAGTRNDPPPLVAAAGTANPTVPATPFGTPDATSPAAGSPSTTPTGSPPSGASGGPNEGTRSVVATPSLLPNGTEGTPETDPLLTDPRTRPLTVGIPPSVGTTSPERGPEPSTVPGGTTPADPGPRPAPGSGDPPTVASVPGTMPPTGSGTTPAPVRTEVPAAEPEAAIGIVARDGGAPQLFPTLEAACTAAQDGDVIELRFNGLRRERPIRIAKKKLAIRGAIGFRPFLEFRHEDVPAEGPRIRMISVDGGALDLVNVDLQMTVEPHVLFDDRFEHWALFSLKGAERLSLQSATIAVTNPGAVPATVVELVPAVQSDLGEMKGLMPKAAMMDAVRPLELRVFESFVRGSGRCDLVVSKSSRPLQADLERSAFALNGALLELRGAEETPADGTDVRLQLEHVTCLLSGGLLRLDSGTMPRILPPLRVTCRNSLLSSAGTAPLVAMTGDTDENDFRRLLAWEAERTFYDRWTVFWSIASSQGTSTFAPLDFDGWRQAWGPAKEVGTHLGGIAWQRDRLGKGIAQIGLEDLALDRSTPSNPGVAAATDGTDVGTDLARLPKLPDPPPRPFE